MVTVAILAQGTSWAVAVTQAYFYTRRLIPIPEQRARDKQYWESGKETNVKWQITHNGRYLLKHTYT